MVRIALTPLAPGLHTIDLEPSPEDLDLDPEAFQDVRVAVRLDVHAERVLAAFTAGATATLTCDRTLDPFDQRVEGSYQVLFAPPAVATADSNEAAWDDVRPLHPSDTHVDLTEPIRDTILLALPTRRVAPGAEEREIPLNFGASDEDAIDPRWEALRKLQSGD